MLLAVPASVCLLTPALLGTRCDLSDRTRCANDLRQFGLAAMQYADDKRFYPHVGKIRELDGGYDSNHTPKVVRTLSFYGYHDNPEGWICPSSYDVPMPVSPDTYEQPRRWFWSGEVLPAEGQTASPLHDDLPDPSLRETSELSYGWTRKGMSSNARSTRVLAADRALRSDLLGEESDALPGEIGCHVDGYNVLKVDATVEWFDRDSDEWPKTLEVVSLYQLSFGRPPPPGFAFVQAPEPMPEWVRTAAPIAGWALLMGWLGHMGWRRRRQWVKPKLLVKRKRWFTVEVIGIRRPALIVTRRGATGTALNAAFEASDRPVTLSPGQRCPYCHDGLDDSADLVACYLCATLLHRECVQEGGTCSTFGCGNMRR